MVELRNEMVLGCFISSQVFVIWLALSYAIVMNYISILVLMYQIITNCHQYLYSLMKWHGKKWDVYIIVDVNK